ncbi:hypothetical protein [Nitrolancea hollandica]|uniref:Blue (Type 1) copper domain protein n=1 Tax=Nitrolancea hollandica Lb TaxID=1129897 RepID=I4EJW3_9BACT|nr:hypothetical protein [Nitrolancea hollandica]CCF84975.1 conserved exported hypothetical protein [Nitrolancea hollandica Lb]
MRRLGYLSTMSLLVMLLGILAACGGGQTASPPPGTTASEAPASAPPAASSPATASPAAGFDSTAGVATVIAKDFSFDAPDTVPAGPITFRLVNQGTEPHHLQLAKLPEGKTIADLEADMSAGKPMNWLIDAGGPNAAIPGDSTIAVAPLEAGQYVLMCVIPSPDGTPHVAKGMIKPLQVTADATTAVEPAANITMTLKDYAFDLSTPVTAGKHTIKVVNAGPQSHEVAVLQFAPGKTMNDFMAWEEGGMKEPPPGKFLGGITAIANGEHGYFTEDFAPGDYALLCFLPDTGDGKPHLAHGMAQSFTIQ